MPPPVEALPGANGLLIVAFLRMALFRRACCGDAPASDGARSYTGPGGRTIPFPREWFESIVPVVHLRGGRVVRIDVHPVVIESSREAGDGRPLPASPALASGILERFTRLSATHGAGMTVRNGVAVIVPDACVH